MGVKRFDALLHMHASARANVVSLAVRSQLRIGFDKARARDHQWLFTNTRLPPRRERHVMDGLFEFADLIGVPHGTPRWDIPVGADDIAAIAPLFTGGAPTLVISPCTGQRFRNYRNWRVDWYAEIADYAAKRYGARVLLTGGNTAIEQTYGREITAMAKSQPHNLIGKTNLKQLLAILQRASVVLCPDSGPAHMATAVGTPVVGLYATSNRHRTGPYFSQHLVVDKYPEAVEREFGKPDRGAALGPTRARPRRHEPDHSAGCRFEARCRVRATRRKAPSVRSSTMERYALRDFSNASPTETEDAMERAEVVFYNRCPVELPNAADLEFMRTGLPRELQVKNISYHPESDSIPRFEAAPEVAQRIETILRAHGQRVEAFLRRTCPDFVPNWTLGTTSFRSIEEQGRKLKPRSSNELVHIDAGAYGATNGARILRFFVNIHPERDRVWGTKGSFNAIMGRHPEILGRGARRQAARHDRQRPVRQAVQRLRRRRRQAVPTRSRARLEPVRSLDAPYPQFHEGKPWRSATVVRTIRRSTSRRCRPGWCSRTASATPY